MLLRDSRAQLLVRQLQTTVILLKGFVKLFEPRDLCALLSDLSVQFLARGLQPSVLLLKFAAQTSELFDSVVGSLQLSPQIQHLWSIYLHATQRESVSRFHNLLGIKHQVHGDLHDKVVAVSHQLDQARLGVEWCLRWTWPFE